MDRLNPFRTVEKYGELLEKVGLWTFISSLLASAWLASQIAGVGQLEKPLNYPIPLFGLSIPFGVVLPALAFAFIARAIRLHDKVSDIFGIRRRFDEKRILLPLAERVGLKLSESQRARLKRERRQLMTKVFYAYISDTPVNPSQFQFYAQQAMDKWSWYWTLIEGSVVAVACCVVLAIFAEFSAIPRVVILIVVILAVSYLAFRDCAKHAADEVDLIASDAGRRDAVHAVLSAL